MRGRRFGALNLFFDTEGGPGRRRMQIARLLARLAAVGSLNNTVSHDQDLLAEQLQTALLSRVVIEQAKGIIAVRAGIRVGAAFELLRTTARASQRPLIDIAGDVVEGRMPPAA